MNSSTGILLKLVIVGDSAVGKSCILLRFADGTFTTSFMSTIGIDFKIVSINLDNRRIKLQVWDTAGQERFRTITSAYYRGAHAILVVYDVGDATSFESVPHWLKQVDRHAADNVKKVLVANKSDVGETEREVSTQEGKELAKKLGVPFFETSAKDGVGVSELFLQVAANVIESLPDDDKSSDIFTPVADSAGSEKRDGGSTCSC